MNNIDSHSIELELIKFVNIKVVRLQYRLEIMSKTLKVMGNVKFASFVLLPISEEAKT